MLGAREMVKVAGLSCARLKNRSAPGFLDGLARILVKMVKYHFEIPLTNTTLF